MEKKLNLILLHGFLGSHRDYALVVHELKRQKVPLQVWAPDFFQPGPVSAAHDYATWTQNFLIEVEQRFAHESCILVGYSLGARLALHAYLAEPKRFHALFLLSANPGLLEGSPQDRHDWENQWEQCFRCKPWSEAMALWNEQMVFRQTTARVTPVEGQLDRHLVADSLSKWSLLRHQYSMADLLRLPSTTEWWFGEQDQKFLQIKARLEQQGIPGQYHVIAQAGHRLPLDQATLLAQALLTRGQHE